MTEGEDPIPVVEAMSVIPSTQARSLMADDASFAIVVDRHYASILRFLTRQTGDAELAADLTQACFLDAYRNRHQLAADDAVLGWIFSIARNQLRMEWRRRQVRRLVSLDWLIGRGAAPPAALGREDGVAALAERDRIQQVLDAMSPALREALLLHSLCGFRGGEVATLLGISPAAARKRIVRAEAEFRERYGAVPAGRAPGDPDSRA